MWYVLLDFRKTFLPYPFNGTSSENGAALSFLLFFRSYNSVKCSLSLKVCTCWKRSSKLPCLRKRRRRVLHCFCLRLSTSTGNKIIRGGLIGDLKTDGNLLLQGFPPGLSDSCALFVRVLTK